MLTTTPPTSTESKVDAVTLELIRGALRSAQQEMDLLMERTAMSPYINEKKDHFAAFTTGDGRLVHGPGNPMGSNMMDAILKQYPADTMKPGDLYWYNDCYGSEGGVSHSPDMVFAAPVFMDGRIVAFTEAYGHFWDIGGTRAGSLSPDATEIYHEGIIVPPVRVFRDGQWNDEVLRLFVRNSRFPDIMRGDIRAMTAAARLGERRIREMSERFGVDVLVDAFEVILDRTRDSFRRILLDTVPEGTYSFSDAVDSDAVSDNPFWVRMTLERKGDHLVLDATATDNQAVGPINFIMHDSVPSNMVAQQIRSGDPTLSLNHGSTQIVDEVRIRPGSILRPNFPAPLGSRAHTWHRSNAVVQGLLAMATGGKFPAAWSSYCLYLLRAFDPETQRFMLCAEGIGVGHGARPTSDGLDVIYYIGQENYPVEYIESEFPLRIERYAVNRDSAGPGRYRGGSGVVREVTFLADNGVLGLRMDNVKYPSWGVNGGQAGRPGRVTINPGRPDERQVKTLSDGHRLNRGDLVRIETSGGGGWGHPFDREPWRVQRDVRAGFVSRESAQEDYGVILDPSTLQLDQEATERYRKEKRPEIRLFHRGEYVDSLEPARA